MREQLVIKPPRLASQPPSLPCPLPANHSARKEADLEDKIVEGDLNPEDKIGDDDLEDKGVGGKDKRNNVEGELFKIHHLFLFPSLIFRKLFKTFKKSLLPNNFNVESDDYAKSGACANADNTK